MGLRREQGAMPLGSMVLHWLLDIDSPRKEVRPSGFRKSFTYTLGSWGAAHSRQAQMAQQAQWASRWAGQPRHPPGLTCSFTLVLSGL